ncbi:spore coat protein YutH [Coprobacillus sp. CAG:826]|nr:hypothetical protein [Coprobacillus sp.]CDD91495.1 spore coat protein YutH [Coprobacillus sp. CAG:826]
MRAFLFDQYGYYPPHEDDSEFELEGWTFKLEAIQDQKEEELQSLNDFLQTLMQLFPTMGAQIITNRKGTFISEDDYGKVILVATKKQKMRIQDIIKIHQQYVNSPSEIPYTTTYLSSLWEEKINSIEQKILPSIRVDDFAYQKIMVAAIYALGLAENALQYLTEIAIDYGKEISPLTLSHRRLESLDSHTVFDPLNLILDSPIRDIAEAWKYKVITTTELLQILPTYQLSIKEVSLLFARMLFPTRFFDLLEKHYGERVDVRKQILAYYREMNQDLLELKKVEQLLVKNYGIRPISWLLNA